MRATVLPISPGVPYKISKDTKKVEVKVMIWQTQEVLTLDVEVNAAVFTQQGDSTQVRVEGYVGKKPEDMLRVIANITIDKIDPEYLGYAEVSHVYPQ